MLEAQRNRITNISKLCATKNKYYVMATETFTLTLDNQGNNIAVTINDTSQSPPPGYSVTVGTYYSSAYTMSGTDRNGSFGGQNPNINLNAGDTMNFSVNVSGHPFWIKNTQVTGTSGGASGVTRNGSTSGIISYTPPSAGTFYYICQIHGGMTGTITVS